MAQTQTQFNTIAGYFEDNADARRAVEALHDAGFSSAQVGLAHRGESSATDTSSGSATHEEGTWDKIKNFFGGDSPKSYDAEPYADERTQGDFANREVTANPADEGRYYNTSDLHQSLTGLDVPEEHSKYFGHRFGSSEGGAVVTVNAGDRRSEAESILQQYGADLGSSAADYDYSQGATTTGRESENIQLLGEVLRVQKDRISRGEVHIRKEVITENQTVQVPVTREELVIERHTAGYSSGPVGTIGEGQEIRIPLTEERASVDKSTVVLEEVAFSKKPVEEVRDLSSQVRHEELIVDDQTKKVG